VQAKLRPHVAAILLLLPAATFLAQPAAAQERAVVASPTINGLQVNADDGVSPGSTLRFRLDGVPRAARADVVLGKSGITVPLRETSPGVYTGSYVVRRADRLDPTQLLAARVTQVSGGQIIARNFSYPQSFQQLAMGAPAAAAPAPGPGIERFVMRSMGRVEPGRELRFRLMGVPGGDAWMDIPGVIRGIDLAEVRPGVYEGTYTVRRRDDLQAFDHAVGNLRVGNRTLTARVDVNGGDRWWDRGDRPVARDDRPPQITDLAPGNGDRITERGRAHIGARLSDEGSGIDPASVRLRLQGRDVTGDARVSGDEVQYRADLDPGRYTAELSVRDRAGNSSTKSWTFDVVGDRGERVGGYGGALPLQITSHANNSVIDADGRLLLQGRTAPYADVRVQVESVANVGGLLGVTTPVLDQTIQADRNGNFSVPVSANAAFIPGQRYDVRMTATSEGRTAEERITLRRQG